MKTSKVSIYVGSSYTTITVTTNGCSRTTSGDSLQAVIAALAWEDRAEVHAVIAEMQMLIEADLRIVAAIEA